MVAFEGVEGLQLLGPWRGYKGAKCYVVSVVSSSLQPPWTIACQPPLSMGFSRQEYWNGLPFPSPGDLSNPRIELGYPALQAYSLPSEPPGKPSQLVLVVKNPPVTNETEEMRVQSLGGEDPLECELATHSHILAWRIAWTEEAGRLQSIGSHRVRHN